MALGRHFGLASIPDPDTTRLALRGQLAGLAHHHLIKLLYD